MDYYVDSSAITRPSLSVDRASRGRVIGELDRRFFFKELVGNESVNAADSWIALYSNGKSVVNHYVPKKPQHSFKISSKSIGGSFEKAKLRSSVEFVYCNDEAAVLDSAKSRVALRHVIDAVEDLADAGEFQALDTLLAMVDPGRLRSGTAVAFLRSSYAVKERLRNWNGLYQVVYAHLSNNRENPDRVMRGLSVPKMEGFA